MGAYKRKLTERQEELRLLRQKYVMCGDIAVYPRHDFKTMNRLVDDLRRSQEAARMRARPIINKEFDDLITD